MPDLSGQPPWVVIVVVSLMAISSIGGAVLGGEGRRRKRRRNRKNDELPEAKQHSVPSLPGGEAHVLNLSVQALVDTARLERQEAEEARRETRAIRMRYDQAMRELDEARRVAQRALADLAHCESNADHLRAQLNGRDHRD